MSSSDPRGQKADIQNKNERSHMNVDYPPPTSSSSSNKKGRSSPGLSIYPLRTAPLVVDSPRISHSYRIVPFSTSKGSLKILLLHGMVDILVKGARNLPNMDRIHKTLGNVVETLPVDIMGNYKNTSDPYVAISIAGAAIGRTYVITNNENPVWMQHFYVPVAHYDSEVTFAIKDDDTVGSRLIGVVQIPVEQIYSGAKIDGYFPLMNAHGRPWKSGSALSFSIQYTPVEWLSLYNHGLTSFEGVPGTYFPIRKGGMVTLYQDAHVPDDCLPSVKLQKDDMEYVHGKCWRDVYKALSEARHLIYITGWSVWHKVVLVRDDESPTISDYDKALGNLLKSKSQEGVRVLLLVWDDPTSTNIMGYKCSGLMGTHDEETRRFFKYSSVQVLLCPRTAGKRLHWLRNEKVGKYYTHHQKTVVVDADAGDNKRKVIAFLGGLDLCNGRYDTPDHHVIRTLNTVHAEDYHNPTYKGTVTGCPREPWHDLHCKIDGQAAYDVLTNFQERWLKASKQHGIDKLEIPHEDALLKIARIPGLLGPSDVPCLSDHDEDSWNIQIFRSLDSDSAKGFPKDPKKATTKNLVCGKNVLIDMSIHTAYIQAIRAAQHFIYIENQYFLGSSYNWSSTAYRELGANNLIPMEIALKICDKIRQHKRFAVYIIIPMWPEGPPTAIALQRILLWQNKTMQMMYEMIYKALVEVGMEDASTPQDYLNFFCLGNREEEPTDENGSADAKSYSAPLSNTPQLLSKKNRRFMIYVHSKGMIVDDEYIIIGSANVNQRSMAGDRDTEIAMGAFQPHHTWKKVQSYPRGQIHGYRMSLWAEHLGCIEEYFSRPESLECVTKIRSMGEANWKQFISSEITEMRGHLLKYPVEIDRTGKVSPIPGCESFPDAGGNICGSSKCGGSWVQEDLTI